MNHNIDKIIHLLRDVDKEINNSRSERNNLIKINAALRDRPDLKDRSKKIDELVNEISSLKEEVAKLKDKLKMYGEHL